MPSHTLFPTGAAQPASRLTVRSRWARLLMPALLAVATVPAIAAEGMPPMPGAAISAASATGLMPASAATAMVTSAQLDANKRTVIAFYEAGLNRKDFDAAKQYFGADYKQHNPNAADGIEGFHKFVDYLRANTPESHSDIVRAFADGNYVILHVRKIAKPGDAPIAIVDIFRLDDSGRIVEHWDVSQQVPPKTVSGNPMF